MSTLTHFSVTVVPPIVHGIELIGVAIIAVGTFVSLAQLLWDMVRTRDVRDSLVRFRSGLGRAILAGLELLVAADIINTVVVDLSIENVASLALIVIIRTLLSFSLEAEIEGRWPWQREAQSRGKLE